MIGRISTVALGRRSRWIVIGVWLVLAIGLGWLQPRLQAKAADESETFRARGAESTLAHEALKHDFREGRWSTSVVAFVATDGDVGAHQGEVAEALDTLCGSALLPDLVGIGAPNSVACGDVGHTLGPQIPLSPFSADTPASMVLTSVFNGKDDTDSMVRDVTAIRRIVPRADARPLSAYVTGPAAFDADRALAVEGIDGTLLAITGVLVLVLMLITYRSPIIAGLMLGVVVIAYLIATGLLYGLVELGATTVSGQSTAILIVLMFGAGTDYALLLVSRYRDELRRTGDVEASIARASERTAPAIVASGGIVVAAMLVLGLADFNATREMGPILALGILVMLSASLTLLPATLSVLSRRAFWPVHPSIEPDHEPTVSRLWTRIGDLVRRRPLLLVVVSVAILGAGALGNLGGRGYLTINQQYHDPPESVQAQDLIAKRFPPGRVAPLDVIAPNDAVTDLTKLFGSQRIVSTANTDAQSKDGKTASMQVVLNLDPFSRAAMDEIPKLREEIHQLPTSKGVTLGGVTAEQHDNLVALRHDAKLIVPLVLILILMILMALLRAVVAPFYVMGTVILSFGFALGASSLIFTHVFGQPNSDPNLSIFAFIFLVALGVDDNIFLMTGIREERARGLSTRDAVISGLQRTGGVITSAGLILAGTFAALMALDLVALFQVGFTVTLGLLVDAFLVRTFLVPSLAVVLGERNWWPSRRLLSGHRAVAN